MVRPVTAKRNPAVRHMASHCYAHFADCAIVTNLELLCGYKIRTLILKLKALSSARLCLYILPNQIKILYYEKLSPDV